MLVAARRCFILLLLGTLPAILAAQASQDSVSLSLELLKQLVQAENFEDAQLEAEQLRSYLQRHELLYPAKAVPLLSKIYKHNLDKKSAMGFLADATADTRRDTVFESRIALLEALVKAFADWDAYPQALACQQAILVLKDSRALVERQVAVKNLQMRLDSLSAVKQTERAEQVETVRLGYSQLYAVTAFFALLFLALIWLNWRTVKRWRSRLEQKNLEIDFLRSDRFTSTLPVETTLPEPPEAVEPPQSTNSAYRLEHQRPEKVALIIEPNRQIVLYLKSLLSDRFEIETASTPNEGLQVAANHLPDLIVCDAVLNGQTGIDVIRQIKLSERTNHIPVILLSEHFGSEGKLDALRAGADAWFNRPVLDKEFDAQVTHLLQARKEKHAIFSRFLHLYFSENRIALSDPFLVRIIQTIEQNLADPDFMADDLARKMQLHKQHFLRKLQALTGKEPVQLIREMRLEKAKSLLEKRAAAPQVIAELVGFASTGSFALAFKEYFGENTSLLQMPDKS